MGLDQVLTDPDLLTLLKGRLNPCAYKTLRLVSPSVRDAVDQTITVVRRGRKIYGDKSHAWNKMRPFAKLLRRFPNLQTLDLSGRALSMSDLRALARVAACFPNLRILNIGYAMSNTNLYCNAATRTELAEALCTIARRFWPLLDTVIAPATGTLDLPGWGGIKMLKKLEVGGKATFDAGTFMRRMPVLPVLEDFCLSDVGKPHYTGAETVRNFVSNMDTLFPRLVNLEFKSCSYLFNIDPSGIVDALAGLTLPCIKDVTLSNSIALDCKNDGSIGSALAKAPWLQRVETLDISANTFSTSFATLLNFTPERAGVGLRAFLRTARMPELQGLSATRSDNFRQSDDDCFSDALAVLVQHTPKLLLLDLSMCTGLVRGSMSIRIPTLTYLCLADVYAAGQQLTGILTRFHIPALETLCLSGCAGLLDISQLIPRFRHVTRLEVDGTELALAGLTNLSCFYRLRVINIARLKCVRNCDIPAIACLLAKAYPTIRVRF